MGSQVHSEAFIQTGFNRHRIPDGFFEFWNGRKIALEVEHANKGERRFKALAWGWGSEEDVAFVLYVATSPQLFRQIQSYLPEVSRRQPMGVVLWDELKYGYPPVWTIKGQMKLFSVPVPFGATHPHPVISPV